MEHPLIKPAKPDELVVEGPDSVHESNEHELYREDGTSEANASVYLSFRVQCSIDYVPTYTYYCRLQAHGGKGQYWVAHICARVSHAHPSP